MYIQLCGHAFSPPKNCSYLVLKVIAQKQNYLLLDSVKISETFTRENGGSRLRLKGPE